MKKILGIVVLLILIILGGYFSTGLVTERTLKKNIKALNQAKGLTTELVNYHRGLFKSKADLTWQMQVPEKVLKGPDGRSIVVPPKHFTFDMPLVIYHGPVMLQGSRMRFGLGAATGEISLPEAYMEEFSERFTDKSTKPKLFLNFFVTYLNKSYVEANLPAFQLFTKQYPTQIDWLGLESELRFSPENTRLEGKLLLQGLRIIGQKFRIILNKLSISNDVHKAQNGLFLGKASLNVPVLQVSQHGKTTIELKQFELNSSSDVDKSLFHSKFHGQFKHLLFRDNTYGPAEIDISLENVDAEMLADLNRRVTQLQQLDPASQQGPQLAFSLLPDIPRLLEQGAVFEVSTLKAALPDGDIDGTMRLAFPKESNLAPLKLLPKVEGEAYVRMPRTFLAALIERASKTQLIRARQEEMVKKAKDMPVVRPLAPSILEEEQAQAKINQKALEESKQKLDDLVRAGALKVKGKDVVLELKLSSGQLLVNGHPFHSGMLSF